MYNHSKIFPKLKSNLVPPFRCIPTANISKNRNCPFSPRNPRKIVWFCPLSTRNRDERAVGKLSFRPLSTRQTLEHGVNLLDIGPLQTPKLAMLAQNVFHLPLRRNIHSLPPRAPHRAPKNKNSLHKPINTKMLPPVPTLTHTLPTHSKSLL